MREFGSSIYTRPVARARPTYRKTSWLDVLRAERRRDKAQAAVDKIVRDGYLYGVGIAHISPVDFYRNDQS